jgi:hypothetical protein
MEYSRLLTRIICRGYIQVQAFEKKFDTRPCKKMLVGLEHNGDLNLLSVALAFDETRICRVSF